MAQGAGTPAGFVNSGATGATRPAPAARARGAAANPDGHQPAQTQAGSAAGISAGPGGDGDPTPLGTGGPQSPDALVPLPARLSVDGSFGARRSEIDD